MLSLDKVHTAQEIIDFENTLYEGEYNAVQDVINGIKTFAKIEDDF